MPENGIDFDELLRPVEARRQGPRMSWERHHLDLRAPPVISVAGGVYLGRIHLVQVDRFAQDQEGLRAVFLHVVIAARE